MDPLLFGLFAGIAVICGLIMVLQTHPVTSALSLIGVMGSLAMLYLLLGAPFIAAAQMIVYAGAIMVLFLFVIMLLNAGREPAPLRPSRAAWLLGLPSVAAMFGALSFFITHAVPPTEHAVKFGGNQPGSAEDVGRALFTTYLLPFEVTSVLVLIAIVGAVVLARKEMD
ncbi:MAG: NADH-quinone oxidoreductase subunit J [Bryobacteraceae bacterium]